MNIFQIVQRVEMYKKTCTNNFKQIYGKLFYMQVYMFYIICILYVIYSYILFHILSIHFKEIAAPV